MKIAILGTRGIPNNYGGYEQITGYVAAGLAAKGHEVTVYNSHNHPNQSSTWNGANIQHCYDPEYLLGTAGQFIYDLNCIRHARKNNFDVWLFMGYTSSSVWRMLFPKNTIIISNMDGVEWKRARYSKPVQQFLKYAERWAVKHSQFHIADSPAIKDYLDKIYGINCRFIPYGASVPAQQKKGVFQKYGIRKKEYNLLIARMEPENNIEMILDGFQSSNDRNKFLVIGKTENKFGKYIVDKYRRDERIKFIGGLFEQEIVNTLRVNSLLYFHGHSVGGTNPSLLEAMASSALIAAHDNVFNRSVLGEDALYFSNFSEVKCLLENDSCKKLKPDFASKNLEKIKHHYNWDLIINSYEEFIFHCYQSLKSEKYFKPEGYAYK
jgi:glycosyltransferase involved in cell wall biosynthesis